MRSQVFIWHRERAELFAALPGHAGTVNAVAWNPTRPGMLASVSDDQTVRIWEPSMPQPLTPPHPQPPHPATTSTQSPSVSADGADNGLGGGCSGTPGGGGGGGSTPSGGRSHVGFFAPTSNNPDRHSRKLRGGESTSAGRGGDHQKGSTANMMERCAAASGGINSRGKGKGKGSSGPSGDFSSTKGFEAGGVGVSVDSVGGGPGREREEWQTGLGLEMWGEEAEGYRDVDFSAKIAALRW